MSKTEQEDRCTDLLQVLTARAQSYCVAYAVDWTDVCSKERVRKKDKGPGGAYKFYHGLQTKLRERNVEQEGMLTWQDIKPLVEEMDQLAGALALEK